MEIILTPPYINKQPDLTEPSYKVILTEELTLVCFKRPPTFLKRWFLRKLFGFKFIIYESMYNSYTKHEE